MVVCGKSDCAFRVQHVKLGIAPSDGPIDTHAHHSREALQVYAINGIVA